MVPRIPSIGIRAIRGEIPVTVVTQRRAAETRHSVVRVKRVTAYRGGQAGRRKRAAFAGHSSVCIVGVGQVSKLRTSGTVCQASDARVVVETISDRHTIGQRSADSHCPKRILPAADQALAWSYVGSRYS